jgi:hypothetical protein
MPSRERFTPGLKGLQFGIWPEQRHDNIARAVFSGILTYAGWSRPFRRALVRIELLLDHRLRPCLLTRRLMLGLKLHPAVLADSNNRNILDSLYDP